MLKAISNVPEDRVFMLKRELGIVLCYVEEFVQSLVILKSNLNNSPSNKNDYILNTKSMSSILHTHILNAEYYARERYFNLSKKKLKQALEYYKKNKKIVRQNDSGLKWRIKRIYLSLAFEYFKHDFRLSMEYFSKAYYKAPKTERERDHNKIYFLRRWQYFVNYWIERGKKQDDLINIFEGDHDMKRFT